MTPEAREHLAKAGQCLARARTIFAAEVPDVAAREAYLAAFHAAQALIAEHTGRHAKTHKGVHVQFARLTRNEPQIDLELRQFLPKAYDMKSIADYGSNRMPVCPSRKRRRQSRQRPGLLPALRWFCPDRYSGSPFARRGRSPSTPIACRISRRFDDDLGQCSDVADADVEALAGNLTALLARLTD